VTHEGLETRIPAISRRVYNWGRIDLGSLRREHHGKERVSRDT
jgi:hypothetical protein